jgi:hypothetical protein
MVKTLIKNAKDIDIGRVLYTGSQLEKVCNVYMLGIKYVFALCITVSASTVFTALLVPFIKLPETETPKLEVEEKSAEAS